MSHDRLRLVKQGLAVAQVAQPVECAKPVFTNGVHVVPVVFEHERRTHVAEKFTRAAKNYRIVALGVNLLPRFR